MGFQIATNGLPAYLCFESVGSSPPLHSYHFAQFLERWDLSLRGDEYKLLSTFCVPGTKMDASRRTLAPLVVEAQKCLSNEWTSLGSYKENVINVKLLWNYCSWINGFQFWLHIRGDSFWSFLEIQVLGLHSPKGHIRQIWTTVISRRSPCASDILSRMKTSGLHRHAKGKMSGKELRFWNRADKGSHPGAPLTIELCNREQVSTPRVYLLLPRMMGGVC